ncbi:MAG: transporter [Zoogloea sp.]|nr:transporter [Zoogloea sp.]
MKTSIKRIALATGLALAATAWSPARAINTDPLDFVAAPAGTNLGLLYYDINSSGAQYTAGSRTGNNSIKADVGIARFVHYTDVGGFIMSPQVLLPAASVSVNGGAGGLSTDGLGDPILAAPLWLVNRPESRTYFALAPYLTLPLGSYDANRPLSVGENRWKFVLQPGLSMGIGRDWTFDLIGDVQVHGHNNDAAGGGTLSQKPLYSVQPQLTYAAGEGYNLSLGAYRYWGGETTLRNVAQADRTNTTTVLGTVAYWIGKRDNLQFQYRADTHIDNGAKTNGFQFRLLHVF